MAEVIDFYDKKKIQEEKKKSDLDRIADDIKLKISKHKDAINLLNDDLRKVLSGELPDGIA